MTSKRVERFKKVVSGRQPDLTVILENVHDMHNIGAVMRTCDSVGIYNLYVLQTDPNVQFSNLSLGKRTSAGTRNWVDVHYYKDRQKCFTEVKKNCKKVFATHLDAQAVALHDMDLTQPIALLFGNEKEGVTKETLELCDGNFIIPQMGFVQSLNISVACAVTLYEAFRQRNEADMYGENSNFAKAKQEELFELYQSRHEARWTRKSILPKELDF